MRRIVVLFALAAFVTALGPAQARADDLSSAIMQAKFMASEGPNAPPDLISEEDTAIMFDGSSGGMSGLHGAGAGLQVNDPALDNIQDFPNALPQPQRPFELSIQSETSVAASGSNVVVGFNNSADQPLVLTPQNTLAFTHRFLSGVGVSHDGGQTFTEYSLPPIPGSPFTFGDPAVTTDRSGNFYYASLGADAAGQSLIFVGKSTDGGTSFAPGVTVAVDPGSDKEWIAAGPDPLNPQNDNVYVTWTSFKANSSQLMLGRSTDGGQTWTDSTVFAPVDNGVESAFIQFSNPVVDQSTGKLYIPFLHGGDTDADYIKVLESDDGGQTFHFLDFNVPGVADPTAFPVVTPGTLSDCGTNGGFRSVLHQGPDLGGGRLGLPRYLQATRLITQPSMAAADGKLFIAYNASTSPVFGDPSSHSEIRLLFSPDGGGSWQGPLTVAAATDADPQHVHPAIATDSTGKHLTVAYYVQQADGKLRVEALTAVAVNNQTGLKLQGRRLRSLGPAFDLIPSNIPLGSPFPPNTTTNYDRTIRPCYDIGEYLSATGVQGEPLAVFGDNRNTWTSPADSPAAGTHTQPDVFAVVPGSW